MPAYTTELTLNLEVEFHYKTDSEGRPFEIYIQSIKGINFRGPLSTILDADFEQKLVDIVEDEIANLGDEA